MSTAPYRQPALPGMKTAAGDAERSALRRCASWTDAETAFADACFNAWNAAFRSHGTRANRTRHGNWVVIQLYKWIHGPANDGEKMTEHDVLAAIAAYAKDPWIKEKCQGRYKSFADWFAGCPDNVDKQLARIGKRRGATAPSADAAQAKSKLDLARDWLRESGWTSHIAAAHRRLTSTGQKASLTESLNIARAELVRQMDLCRSMPPRLAMLKAELDDIDGRLELIGQFNAIDKAARKNIFDRAHRACEPINDGRERTAATLALSLEILRRYGPTCRRQSPPPPNPKARAG